MKFFISILFIQLFYQAFSQDKNPCSEARKLINSFEFEKAYITLRDSCKEESADIYFLKGICLAKLGRFSQAKTMYGSALESDPKHSAAMSNLGHLLQTENKHKPALDYFEQLIRLDSLNSYFHKQAGVSAFRLGELTLSASYYEKTLELNPGDFEAANNLIEIFIIFDYFEESKGIITKMLKQDPSNIQLLQKKAKVHYKYRDYKSSYETIKNLLVLGDTNSYFLQMLGVSAFHLKKYQECIDYLKILVEQEEATDVTHYYLGLAYRESGFHNKCTEHLNKSIELSISTNIAHYYTQLAITYEEKKNYAMAIKYYQAAYQQSQDKKLLYYLARSYDEHYKDKKQALKYYEKYLAENDTLNEAYQEYSRYRINSIKELRHFALDTLN